MPFINPMRSLLAPTSAIIVLALQLSCCCVPAVNAFVPPNSVVSERTNPVTGNIGEGPSTRATTAKVTSTSFSFSLSAVSDATTSTPSSSSSSSSLKQCVVDLKRVLEREYASFFDPMRTEYYSPRVTFEDPLTSLDGVGQYQTNVDMLASRTWLGKFLFADAGIVLHSVTGGKVQEPNTTNDGSALSISDITTRWTLRLTAKVLPWKPTARFTGVSIYKVRPNSASPVGVEIVGQEDYWDSINIVENSNGSYKAVDKSVALQDFLGQLQPGGFQAVPAAPEVPYQLLRRGNGYEVRRYPSICTVTMPYGRRDEGFGSLGAFTRGMTPLGPAIMKVGSGGDTKTMAWPLNFAPPGQTAAPMEQMAVEKAKGQWAKCDVRVLPARVVAVREFSDASMEPVVRRGDRELRASLQRDGISVPDASDDVQFAQYDAIFSMGKRRGEVWIDLEDGTHPW